jgi:hypothetical protein
MAIPPELHSALADGPFRVCSDCGVSLLAPDLAHLIGKTWNDGEVIFEFALCMTCALALFSQYSEESKKNLEAYFMPLDRVERSGLTACVRCGRTDGLAAERHVEAVAHGDMLLDDPILICAPCAEGAEAVLSKATKEAFDRFARRVFPTLPADVDLPAVFSLP